MKNVKKQRGVSLILVFLMMIIITSAVLFTGLLLGTRISTVNNIVNSISSFYLADTGIEKVLYYDRKLRVDPDVRGVCWMCVEHEEGSNKRRSCPECKCSKIIVESGNGSCDADTCSNCTVSFSSVFESDYGYKEYTITARVAPEGEQSYDLDISSTGNFSNVGRAIKVLVDESPIE